MLRTSVSSDMHSVLPASADASQTRVMIRAAVRIVVITFIFLLEQVPLIALERDVLYGLG